MTWPDNLKPHAIIERYLDAGIPVIVGLRPWDPKIPPNMMHAVVATGHTLRRLDAGHPISDRPTRAEFVSYFLVNDDQRGTNLRMAIDPAAQHRQTPYSMQDVAYLIVPLPEKVFTPAEHAESIAWGLIEMYAAQWGQLKNAFAVQLEKSIEAGDAFVQEIANKRVVARTYLTHGWRYKQRMIQNTCTDGFKSVINQHDLPRYVWVTEFGTLDSLNHIDEDQARIFAHAVLDATSSHFWEGRCIFHAPGYASRWYHSTTDRYGESVQAMALIANDVSYRIKIRGH